MLNFDDAITVRETLVEGVGPWFWVKADTGAWEGPHKEFGGLREHFVRNCRRRRVMVQAGGCLGMYPRLWADWFERVYTFEPDPLNFYVLSKNVAACPNVIPYNAALGDCHEPLYVRVRDATNVGMNQVRAERPDGDWPRAPQMMVDDLDLEHCDAIQLDCEGYEPWILNGAAKTVDRCRPVISSETVSTEVRKFMTDMRYKEVGRNVSDTIFAPM